MLNKKFKIFLTITIAITTLFISVINTTTAFSQVLQLDNAISEITREISRSIPRGSRVAVVNIASDYPNLSNYVINELTANLVKTGTFNVIPRNQIEIEMATREMGFQMSGMVSQSSVTALGNFVGAEFIVMGNITKDSQTSYRLSVDAIALEKFVYKASSRKRFQDTERIRALTESKDALYVNYTAGERIGMSALNVFFGAGSISRGHHIGWVTTTLEAIGIATFLVGYSGFDGYQSYENKSWATPLMSAGVFTFGAGLLFGVIVPFFHNKPMGTNVSANDYEKFPIMEYVLYDNYDNKEITGFRVGYGLRF